jgi:hypothetical protein
MTVRNWNTAARAAFQEWAPPAAAVFVCRRLRCSYSWLRACSESVTTGDAGFHERNLG